MKKMFLISVTILPFALGLFCSSAFGQNTYYYKQSDFCGFYTAGACQQTVTICRDWGGDYCVAFEQVPCAEVCNPRMSG